MNSIEIEGKTIDAAIEKACSEFNVPREKLNIEIISDGATGFLGLGSKKAKIKASIMSIDMAIDTPAAQSNKGAQRKSYVISASIEPAGPEDSAESPAMRAKLILEGILQRMNLDCPLTVEETADTILLNIKGDGSGLLIGKRGQNLDAIQYIVNKSVSKNTNNRKMIVLDTESYRKKKGRVTHCPGRKAGRKSKKIKEGVDCRTHERP